MLRLSFPDLPQVHLFQLSEFHIIFLLSLLLTLNRLAQHVRIALGSEEFDDG